MDRLVVETDAPWYSMYACMRACMPYIQHNTDSRAHERACLQVRHQKLSPLQQAHQDEIRRGEKGKVCRWQNGKGSQRACQGVAICLSVFCAHVCAQACARVCARICVRANAHACMLPRMDLKHRLLPYTHTHTRASHQRTAPSTSQVLEVVEVIASIKGVDPSVVAEATFQNTLTVLFNS